MTPSDASRVIETLFNDVWTQTPVVFENTPARDWAEAGQPALSDGTTPYIELEISAGYAAPITIPTGCVRRYANLSIAIMIPRDSGARQGDDIFTALQALLQFKEFVDASGTLRFKGVSSITRNVLVNEWVRSVALAFFEYEHEVE